MALPLPAPTEAVAQTAVQTPQWHRYARYGAALMLAAGVLAAFFFVAPIAVIVVAGLILAALTGTCARWLTSRTGMRFLPAVVIIYLILVVGIIVLAFTGIPWLVRALEMLVTAVRAANADFGGTTATQAAASPAVQRLSLIFTTDQIQQVASAIILWVINLLANILKAVGWTIYTGALALFLSFLIHIDLGERGLRALDRLPGGYQRELRILRASIIPLWVRFIGAEIVFGTALAIGSLVEFVILGVPYPAVMAILTGVITLIPSIGGLLASLIVAVPCLLLGSTRFPDMSPFVFTAIVTLINVLITQGSYNFVFLPVVGKAVKLPISVVLVGVLASFAFNSILFAFLLVPGLASLRVIVAYLVAKIRRVEPFPEEPMVAAP